MKRLVFFLLALVLLPSCRIYDKYTGEPFLREVYTLNGQQHVYEDWGHQESSFLATRFVSDSFCPGVYEQNIDNQQFFASFELHSKDMTLLLDCDEATFTDGKRYPYQPDLGDQSSSIASLRVNWGWFSLTKKSADPTCLYELHFSFQCLDANGSSQLCEGTVQINRRMAPSDSYKKLISNQKE